MEMLFNICFALVFLATCNGQAPNEATATQSSVCTQRNGYYKIDASCDGYVECIEYRATKLSCPDGLHFNMNTTWPNYPCGYPMDVPCIGRGSSQPAKPTADCPHQYGFFASPAATADNCGQYRMCVAGEAFEMICPTGLAFNPATSRCDWPDLVPSCKVEDFLGFQCPPTPLDADGKPIALVVNYKYNGNCYYFFSCENGHPRLLSCDEGLAFDPALGRCVNADRVDCMDTVPS